MGMQMRACRHEPEHAVLDSKHVNITHHLWYWRSLRINRMSKNGQEKKIERLTIKMLLLPSMLFCMQLDNTCGPQSRNVAMSDQGIACLGMSKAFGVAEG